jgi:hypothetical protein
MNDRDKRPLNEIEFAKHGANHDLDLQDKIREWFKSCGVACAQDIIDLGCTGLLLQLGSSRSGILGIAQTICENMAGSICGLPCYVPNNRFCLVHNTIGGLQVSGNLDGPQVNKYPESIKSCSRSLTDQEREHFGQVQAKIALDGFEEAKLFFGAELAAELADTVDLPTDPLGDKVINAPFADDALQAMAPSCPVALPPFQCREHDTFNSGCRFCLAQSIAEGAYAPSAFVNSVHDNGNCERVTLDFLPTLLASESIQEIELYVLAARWKRKLVKD